MLSLALAAALFILIHRAISGSPVRALLVGAIGEGPYRGAFALASALSLGWMIYAFGQAHVTGQGRPDWADQIAVRIPVATLQLLAFLLIVPGVLTPNPTSVGQGDSVSKAGAIQGMLRITRHPFLWGVALFGTGHLLVRQDWPSVILFGTLIVVALTGTISIDAKRRRQYGAAWAPFATQTSNLPFAAIASGPQTLKLAEIGWWRPLVAVGIWAGLIFAHRYVSGGWSLLP